MVLLLIVVGVMFAVAVGTALVFLIPFLIKRLGGNGDGWRRLVEAYATEKPTAGQTVKVQALQIGAVTYNRCATPGYRQRRVVRDNPAEDCPDPVD